MEYKYRDITLFVYSSYEGQPYLKARSVHEAEGAEVGYEDIKSTGNPLLVVQKGDITIKMPINRNIAYVNDEPYLLNGLVLASGMNAFVPQEAVNLLIG
jgi:hypothetical protein